MNGPVKKSFIFQGQNTYYLNVIGAAGCLVADNYDDGKTELCNWYYKSENWILMTATEECACRRYHWLFRVLGSDKLTLGLCLKSSVCSWKNEGKACEITLKESWEFFFQLQSIFMCSLYWSETASCLALSRLDDDTSLFLSRRAKRWLKGGIADQAIITKKCSLAVVFIVPFTCMWKVLSSGFLLHIPVSLVRLLTLTATLQSHLGERCNVMGCDK